MNNFFNTPSSFGFNTQSSYSPDLRNGRQNLSYEDLVQNINEEQDIEEQNDSYNLEQGEDENQEQMLEKVYAGLSNIQKTKIITVIFKILSNKVYFRYFYAFGVLLLHNKYKPISGQSRKYKNSQKEQQLYILLHHHMKNSNSITKRLVFRNLQSCMDQSRHKQLKLMYLLSNLTNNSYTYLLREAFNEWKKSLIGHRKYKKNKKLSPNFILAKKQIACKLLLTTMRKLLTSQFYKLKYINRITEKKKESVNENSGKTRKNSSNSFKNKSPNISASVISTSYTHQMINTKKMIKMPQRSVQAKSGVKSYARICYSMSFSMSRLIMKKKRQFFNCLVRCIKHEEERRVQQNDDPAIFTNILKHICWLYSKESIKQNGQRQTELEIGRIKKQRLRQVIAKKRRTQKDELIKIIRNWSRTATEQKIKIMKEVKNLQNLKYNYVESYK